MSLLGVMETARVMMAKAGGRLMLPADAVAGAAALNDPAALNDRK